MDGSPGSKMVLRPVRGERIGTTAFFRNVSFLETLARLLESIEEPRVLFHGCSTGAEPYSFAMVWRKVDGRPITIHATDVEPSFLDEARKLTHPQLEAAARTMVAFLPPASVVEFNPAGPYHAVACMNVLCYLTKEQQRNAIRSMAGYAERYLCVTAADPHVVRQELEAAKFAPVKDNWRAIYYGWRERLSWGYRKTWKLPYVPMLMPNWRWSGTSIFARSSEAAHL